MSVQGVSRIELPFVLDLRAVAQPNFENGRELRASAASLSIQNLGGWAKEKTPRMISAKRLQLGML